jgi:hypothetical protein
MTALYTKYKEKGLTRGEIRKIAAKPKPLVDGPIDLAFVDQFFDKLYALDVTKLSEEQMATLLPTLVNLRSMVYQKMKALRYEE